MKCKICGKEIPDGSTSCKYCGAKLQKKSSSSRASKKGRARRTLMTVGLTVLTVLLIFAVGVGVVKVVQKLSNSNFAEEINKAAEEVLMSKEDPELTKEDEEKKLEEAKRAEEEKKAKEAEEAKRAEEEKKAKEAEEAKRAEEMKKAEEEKKAEEQKTEEEKKEEETPVIPSGKYTLSVDRTETVATIDHYREIKYWINEELPAGVTIKSTEWKSSDSSIVRTEEVDGLCRAWGLKGGEATVTLTVTLSDGEKLQSVTKVTVNDPNAQQGGSGVIPGETTAKSGSNSYVLADSSSRVYTAAELQKLSNYDLMIARNEIFARHGYIFKDSGLKSYFESQSWYSGTVEGANFNYSVFNATEAANISAIQSVEATR